MIEALYCRAVVVGGWFIGGWLVVVVDCWWGGPFADRVRVRRSGQGNGRATAGQHQGGNAGVGAGPGHKPSTKLDIMSLTVRLIRGLIV